MVGSFVHVAPPIHVRKIHGPQWLSFCPCTFWLGASAFEKRLPNVAKANTACGFCRHLAYPNNILLA